ncbi:MAG: HD domain-containing protein [Firmicutes bacterium]|nr:HD domain-containing protein [Bacillota bacterium]
MFEISSEALKALNILNNGGHLAYLAGGCVRDLVMGKAPQDWDITTSAEPEETKQTFEAQGFKTIVTGIAHGTVTAVINGENIEITTFRCESEYSDHRRPDSVSFVKTPEEDVKRRDFTMNGLLYHPDEGVLDLVGGMKDIEEGIIRCIGEPDERFSEDALRIMRALRFSSALGFTIEKATSDSMFKNKHLLNEISQERKAVELNKLLMGKDVKFILFEYSDILQTIIPEIKPMIGFDQHNPHHCYDVWIHTIEAVASAPAELVLRLTMLLHDIGKPSSCTMDSYGIYHFYNHPGKSAAMAKNILGYMKYPNDITETVCTLIQYHDFRFPAVPKSVKKLLNKIGEENFRLLLKVRRADISAQSPHYIPEKLALLDETAKVFEKVISEEECFKIKDLKINGKDLMELGVPQGKKIGQILETLLMMVINEEIDNKKNTLLKAAQKMI